HQNAEIDGPADDTEARTWRDHSIYSGGANQAVDDLANIPQGPDKPKGYDGPTWADLRKPGGMEDYMKLKHIDLMSEHSQKVFKEGFHKKELITKPEDAKYADSKPL